MQEIRTLYAEGLSIREVARRTGISFSTVRHYLSISGLHRIKHERIHDGMATCNQCNERKAEDEFPGLSYGTYRCATCLRAAQSEYQLHRHGCEIEQYQALLEAQGGKCAICGTEEGHRSRYGRVCRLAVDHDHSTGKVRGLLCNNCNRGLGRFKDSIESLEAAISYLKWKQ
jgi:hypothetical protein